MNLHLTAIVQSAGAASRAFGKTLSHASCAWVEQFWKDREGELAAEGGLGDLDRMCGLVLLCRADAREAAADSNFVEPVHLQLLFDKVKALSLRRSRPETSDNGVEPPTRFCAQGPPKTE